MPTMQAFRYDDLFPYERTEVRQAYEHAQGHTCYYCGNHLEDVPTEGMLAKRIDLNIFPHNFFDNPIHLHHNKLTGMTLGAVHAHCNAVLFQYDGE